MSKNATKSNPQVNQIFDDLDKYRHFCSMYGYCFNEAELYNSKSYVYRQFQKFISGKAVKDQWEIDRAKFKEEEINRVF